MYDIISGQARTNQIYGLPLIEILPEFMPAWEVSVKRLMDILISIGILGGLIPFWLLIGIIIKLDSRGKILYQQERVGKDGRKFNIFKFRSMSSDAESETGPVWATEDDPRVTRVGKFLRATRIDEVPQFINVLMGDMSLVGPRPERQYFVDQLKKEMPLYTRRLRISPGITGWAQIKHKYDVCSLDGVQGGGELRQKVVSRKVGDSPAVIGHQQLDLLPVPLELVDRGDLIRGHQPRVPDDVCGDDRYKPAVDLIFSHRDPSSRSLRQGSITSLPSDFR